MARKRDLKEWLEFLNIPHHPASDGKEILTACFYPDCEKDGHFYINAADYTYYCHHCGQGGGPDDLEKIILEWVVRHSEGKANDYWESRGFAAETIKRFRLGFYEPLQRYTIPYQDFASVERTVSNISFRASREEQEPKYVRLPGVPSSVFEIVGEQTDSIGVVITEGELDAISIWQCAPGRTLLGLPGASFINDRLVASIPRGAKVIAIVDSDAAGKRAATKLRERIPSVTILTPTDAEKDSKDVNELLVKGGEAEVLRLLSLSPKREDGPDGGNVGTPSGVPSSVYINLPDEQGDWLVKDIWMDQAIGFVAGIPKTMKSMLALHLGYHIASGTPFATKEIVRPGPVLLFQEEDNDHIIKSRLRAIGDGRGTSNLWLFTPGITKRHLRLDSDDAVEMLDAAIQVIAPVAVILDPLANMHTLEDENNSGQINKILERIRFLRDLRKCAFMIVHHMRKEGEGRNTVPGQKMRGSSVFHAKSESSLYVEKWGNLLYVNVENKLLPGRVLHLRYAGKEFILEDELGEGIEAG